MNKQSLILDMNLKIFFIWIFNHHIRNIKVWMAIAVQKVDADLVTLLRLAALNEEIRENDMFF